MFKTSKLYLYEALVCVSIGIAALICGNKMAVGMIISSFVLFAIHLWNSKKEKEYDKIVEELCQRISKSKENKHNV